MKSILYTTVATLALTTTAFAAEIGGSVAVDVAENAAGDFAAETDIDITVAGGAGSVALGFTTDGDDVKLDGYSLGTTVRGMGVSFGDQGDVFDAFEGGLETVGGATLADPSDERESVTVNTGTVLVSLGFTDIQSDISDIENVQVAYGTALGAVALDTGIDYNVDTKETALGLSAKTFVSSYLLGATATYDSASELFGYEVAATAGRVTGFLDGDSDDMVQNLGAGYVSSVGNMSYYAEASYNLDDKEVTPAIGVAFNF